ncbi:MAG: GNAT family N-acetyltransferase, partial [Chloroflexota bacterium]|nr:GNAT family N-acetyltransferase [Chloroflexota bacterium]
QRAMSTLATSHPHSGDEHDADPREGADELLGPIYSWWCGDPWPEVDRAPPIQVVATQEFLLLAALAHLPVGEVQSRLEAGHRPYIATLEDLPVAYGWSASKRASIGAFGLDFRVPPGNRYLWDFATLPAWRGRGVYPSLLRAIVLRESARAGRFWIGHDPDNRASARGIVKAGFIRAGLIYRLEDRSLLLRPLGDRERSEAAASLLGIHLLPTPGRQHE